MAGEPTKRKKTNKDDKDFKDDKDGFQVLEVLAVLAVLVVFSEPVRHPDRHHRIDRVVGDVLLDLRLLAVEEDLEGLAGDRIVERATGRDAWRQGGLALALEDGAEVGGEAHPPAGSHRVAPAEADVRDDGVELDLPV